MKSYTAHNMRTYYENNNVEVIYVTYSTHPMLSSNVWTGFSLNCKLNIELIFLCGKKAIGCRVPISSQD